MLHLTWLLGCPLDGAWCLVCELCRLAVVCVHSRCSLPFVFLGSSRRHSTRTSKTSHHVVDRPPCSYSLSHAGYSPAQPSPLGQYFSPFPFCLPQAVVAQPSSFNLGNAPTLAMPTRAHSVRIHVTTCTDCVCTSCPCTFPTILHSHLSCVGESHVQSQQHTPE